MKKYWDNLGSRERTMILAGAGVALLIALVQFAVLPFWEERERVARAIDAQEKTLQEMNAQLAEYRVLKRDMDSIQRAMAARPPNFTLLSFVERKAREAGVRPNVKAINPSRGVSTGAYEEALADVSLEKVTLRQLVQFLHQAESPRDAVRVRKLTVDKSPESPEYLMAAVQLVTYQAVADPRPAPGPAPAPTRKGG